MRKFVIITLFPEMFEKVLGSSMMWKAGKDKIVEYKLIDLREFGLGPRHQVDDKPYGGGDGMLMMIEPLYGALEAAKKIAPKAKVLLTTPKGIRWQQQYAKEYADSGNDYIIICGHYEGMDERIEQFVDQDVSIGDYVLTGGEIPAMAIIDSIVRLIPGVLGGETSAEIESFSDGSLEFPQYTRPEEFMGMKVPDILLSGHHENIKKWRDQNSKKLS